MSYQHMTTPASEQSRRAISEGFAVQAMMRHASSRPKQSCQPDPALCEYPQMTAPATRPARCQVLPMCAEARPP
jgi:hypothetical protein